MQQIPRVALALAPLGHSLMTGQVLLSVQYGQNAYFIHNIWLLQTFSGG